MVKCGSYDNAVRLVPSVVPLVVCLVGIGVPELWRDEVSSWSASGRSRRRPRCTAVPTAVAMASAAAFSRYAQEARGCAVVTCTVAAATGCPRPA